MLLLPYIILSLMFFSPEIYEDVTVGRYVSETCIDFSIRSMLAKNVDIGFGFGFEVLKYY